MKLIIHKSQLSITYKSALMVQYTLLGVAYGVPLIIVDEYPIQHHTAPERIDLDAEHGPTR
jgi:hypothetical protein